MGNSATFLSDPSGLQESGSKQDVVREAVARLHAYYSPIRAKVTNNARRNIRNRLYELRKALAYDPEVLARDVHWRLMQVNTTLRVLQRGQGPLEAKLRRASLPYSRDYANDGRYLSTEERLAAVLPAVDELYQHEVVAAPLVTLRDELTTFIRENRINEPRRPPRLANPDELARGNLNTTVFSLLPVLGEADDIDTLTSTDAPAWERSVALGSLAINVVTLGFAPNAGGLSRGAKRELEILSELAVAPRSYGDIMEDVARVGLVEAPNSAVGRFRGEPFAYGTGTRSQRVTALMADAEQAAGVRLADLVDEVRYTARGGTEFYVDMAGRRIINIGPDTFGKTGVGQLVDGVHEIGHAIRYDSVLRANKGNFVRATDQFFDSVPYGSDIYALQEMSTETFAIRRVMRHLGPDAVNAQQRAASVRYINDWRARFLGGGN